MKAIFIGSISSGKTTLIQCLNDMDMRYQKTQAVDYVNNYIDTPGEYMQVRSFWCSLTVTAYEADIICLIQDASSEDCWFSGGISSKFAKPVIGIVTKIDRGDANLERAFRYLKYAGCREIYFVSSLTGEGICSLRDGLLLQIMGYKKENAFSYKDEYFD